MSDDNKLSENVEEYLEMLYKLGRTEERVSTSAIAESLKIAPASVTQMLKKLKADGYVDYSPYKGAKLTDKGLGIAKKITRKHRLLERFLHDVLKIRKEEVHEQACEMEHALSDEVERALCQFLKHPERCPDDDEPIPACDLGFSSCEECLKKQKGDMGEIGTRGQNSFSLIDLKKGDTGRIIFIRGGQKRVRRLLDMGITPNATIKIIEATTSKGPVEISVRGSNLALGHSIAANVFVDLTEHESGACSGE